MATNKRTAYGSVPSLADFSERLPSDSISELMKAGLENLGDATKLGKGITEAQQDILDAIIDRVPGLRDMQASSGQAISSMISGELPGQVGEQIASSMNALGLGGGFGPNSDALKHLTAQKLGVSSLGVIQQGLQAAQGWVQSAGQFMAKPFDIAQGFLPSPEAFHQSMVSERDSAFNVESERRRLAAMPDPELAARENLRLTQAGRQSSLAMMPSSSSNVVSWQQGALRGRLGLDSLAQRREQGGFSGMASRAMASSGPNMWSGQTRPSPKMSYAG